MCHGCKRMKNREHYWDRVLSACGRAWVMGRPGRHHRLTAVALCVHLIIRRRRRLRLAEIQRVSAVLRRAWAHGERRRAPPDLHEHMDAAPALRQALPPYHRVVDTLEEGTAVPSPRVDGRGRRLHALVSRDDVMTEMLEGGAALVWATVPALGMVAAEGERCYMLSAGSRGACDMVDRRAALRAVAARSNAAMVPCNVFRDF